MAITVNHAQAKDCIIRNIKGKIVPFLRSSPGMGKSALIESIAQEFRLKVIDQRLAQSDPTDFLGMPTTLPNGRATYAPMDTYPLEGDPIPAGYTGWLLFLDEFNSGKETVQAAAYKLVLNRMTGNHHLHPNVAIVAAGNLETDNAIVEEMSTALQSRLTHYELALDVPGWLEWAQTSGMDHRITSYIEYRPTNLYSFKPDHTDRTYACPRTWEFVNRLIKGEEQITGDHLALVAGAISEGMAREWIGYCQIYTKLARISDIVANPTGLVVPAEPSVLFALTGMISEHVSEQNVTPVMQYVSRLPKEFQVVTLRGIFRKKPDLKDSKVVKDWTRINARELF